MDLYCQIMFLLFNKLSRLVMTFFPRSKQLLISWLQSPCAVILEPPKIKSDTASSVSPSFSHEVMGPDAMILVFWMLTYKSTYSLSSFTFIKQLFSSLLSAIRVVSPLWHLSDTLAKECSKFSRSVFNSMRTTGFRKGKGTGDQIAMILVFWGYIF